MSPRAHRRGRALPGATSRNFLGLFSGREAAGKQQTENVFQLVFLGTKQKRGWRKKWGRVVKGFDGQVYKFEFNLRNVDPQ